ncbi:MAG: PIG-L family deacetylase [Verrucomicrobiota bacterium]
MNPYLEFVKGIETGVQKAKGLSVSGKVEAVESESKVLLFSPHPDDECITGLLPLRLMREAGMQIINVPVTFGSNVERQSGRAAELEAACGYLGWEIIERNGFENLEASDIVGILKTIRPRIVFMPHEKDWNSRHISTHFLVAEALGKMPEDFSCLVVETEFWGAMDDPNLMVEADTQTVADLVAATSLHTEEVARNPYHLLLPAWMQDNVRRGGELVGGQGGAVPDFSFATLYRLRKWQNGELADMLESGISVPADAALNEIFG